MLPCTFIILLCLVPVFLEWIMFAFEGVFKLSQGTIKLAASLK